MPWTESCAKFWYIWQIGQHKYPLPINVFLLSLSNGKNYSCVYTWEMFISKNLAYFKLLGGIKLAYCICWGYSLISCIFYDYSFCSNSKVYLANCSNEITEEDCKLSSKVTVV